jgi:hypothetical protein
MYKILTPQSTKRPFLISRKNPSTTDWLERGEAEFNSSEVQALIKKAEQVLGEIGLDVAEEINRNTSKTKSSLENGSLYSARSTIMYLVSGTKL